MHSQDFKCGWFSQNFRTCLNCLVEPSSVMEWDNSAPKSSVEATKNHQFYDTVASRFFSKRESTHFNGQRQDLSHHETNVTCPTAKTIRRTTSTIPLATEFCLKRNLVIIMGNGKTIVTGKGTSTCPTLKLYDASNNLYKRSIYYQCVSFEKRKITSSKHYPLWQTMGISNVT